LPAINKNKNHADRGSGFYSILLLLVWIACQNETRAMLTGGVAINSVVTLCTMNASIASIDVKYLRILPIIRQHIKIFDVYGLWKNQAASISHNLLSNQ
jgi:hypothetical protein